MSRFVFCFNMKFNHLSFSTPNFEEIKQLVTQCRQILWELSLSSRHFNLGIGNQRKPLEFSFFHSSCSFSHSGFLHKKKKPPRNCSKVALKSGVKRTTINQSIVFDVIYINCLFKFKPLVFIIKYGWKIQAYVDHFRI